MKRIATMATIAFLIFLFTFAASSMAKNSFLILGVRSKTSSTPPPTGKMLWNNGDTMLWNNGDTMLWNE